MLSAALNDNLRLYVVSAGTSGPAPGRTPITERGSTGAEDTTRETFLGYLTWETVVKLPLPAHPGRPTLSPYQYKTFHINGLESAQDAVD